MILNETYETTDVDETDSMDGFSQAQREDAHNVLTYPRISICFARYITSRLYALFDLP